MRLETWPVSMFTKETSTEGEARPPKVSRWESRAAPSD